MVGEVNDPRFCGMVKPEWYELQKPWNRKCDTCRGSSTHKQWARTKGCECYKRKLYWNNSSEPKEDSKAKIKLMNDDDHNDFLITKWGPFFRAQLVPHF